MENDSTMDVASAQAAENPGALLESARSVRREKGPGAALEVYAKLRYLAPTVSNR
jgi:hypothetical protein